MGSSPLHPDRDDLPTSSELGTLVNTDSNPRAGWAQTSDALRHLPPSRWLAVRRAVVQAYGSALPSAEPLRDPLPNAIAEDMARDHKQARDHLEHGASFFMDTPENHRARLRHAWNTARGGDCSRMCWPMIPKIERRKPAEGLRKIGRTIQHLPSVCRAVERATLWASTDRISSPGIPRESLPSLACRDLPPLSKSCAYGFRGAGRLY